MGTITRPGIGQTLNPESALMALKWPLSDGGAERSLKLIVVPKPDVLQELDQILIRICAIDLGRQRLILVSDTVSTPHPSLTFQIPHANILVLPYEEHLLPRLAAAVVLADVIRAAIERRF